MKSICCLGMLVADVTVARVNEMPPLGTIKIVEKVTAGIGGCASNAAVDLTRLGMNASVVGMVGDDLFGNYLINSLANEGVNTDGIAVSKNVSTSAAIAMVSDSGERCFLHCRGTNVAFTYEDININTVLNSDILFFGGALYLPSFDGEPAAKLLKTARENGVYTAMDVAWDDSGRWLEAVEPCLPYLNLFIPSIDEARMLSDKDDIKDMADFFIEKGVGLCVIKDGKRGCYVKSSDGENFFSPAYDRIKAIDTSGAGDSFVAGFLTGLCKGLSLKDAASFANAVGAFCVSEYGTTTGVCSYDKIIKFIEDYKTVQDIKTSSYR